MAEPTYHALRLHIPHIGATALPVDVRNGGSLPDGSSAVSGTASRSDTGVAVTLVNRHHRDGASVRITCADAPDQASGQILTGDSPRAVNSLRQPEAVAPAAHPVRSDGRGEWLVDLPAHSMATIVIRPS